MEPSIDTRDADSVSTEAVRTWVARAQAGDAEAFSPIVAAHRDKLFRFTLNITRNRHDAEDICQRTFINAWKHLSRFDNSRPFSNWLFGIAYKDAVKLVTRRKPVTGEMPELACEGVAPDTLAASAETPMWDLARAELSPERHAMMWMHYGEDLPVAEIARITGRTVVSVKVHLFRSRAILRERLDKAEKAKTLKPTSPLSSRP